VLVAAIVACEIGFWVVLATGLVARYLLSWRRTGAAVLAAVPLVDLALLVFSVLDLRSGAQPRAAHGLAAVYLGFSVAFGPALVRWADVRFAHRWAGGPPPEPKPAGGTPARLRLEWRDFGRAVLAAAISAALLLGAVLLVGDRADTAPLLGWLWRLGLVLGIWLLGWPVPETVRRRRPEGTPPARPLSGTRPRR
jgi:hypothetical protein